MDSLKLLIQLLHIVAGILVIFTGYLIATDQFYKVAIIKHKQEYGVWLILSGLFLLLYRFQQLVYPEKDKKMDNKSET